MNRRPFYFAARKAVPTTQAEKNRRARVRRWMDKGAPWLVDATELCAVLVELRSDFFVFSAYDGDTRCSLDVLNDPRFFIL